MTPNPSTPRTPSAPHTSSPNVAELVHRLTQQRDLYEQLKALSAQQAGFITEGRTEQLLSVLSERQHLVDRIGALSTELAPYRERWPELSRAIAAPDRERVNGLLEQVESLLQCIVEQDDRDRAQLQTARQKVAGEIEQVRQGSRAVNAYKAAPTATAAPPRFTDRRG